MNPNQSQPTSSLQEGLDPQAVNLAKAIRQTESGGDFTAKGKSGEYGAYQYTPDTWAKDSVSAGINVPLDKATPQQQNEVAYKKIKSLKDAGHNVGEIASIWNSGDPQAYVSGKSGINSSGVKYDVPAYAKSVANAYQTIKNGGQAPIDPNNPSSIASETNQSKPESLGGKAWDVAKAAGNFLFPIVGDVYHDIKGDNKKTFLQQAGDTALSVLPFIPGLGQAGEVARGAKLGIEGAEALTKGAGLLGKIGESTIAKGAITGYGAGVASNLSQGQGLGESLTPNAGNLLGAGLGAAAPALIKGTKGLIDKVAGISPQIETELKRLGTAGNPEDARLFDQYISATKSHATDVRTPAPLSIAADNLDKAANKISDNVEKAGAYVGAAKDAASTIPLKPLNEVGNGFWKNVQDKYGLNIFTKNNGQVVVKPIEGSLIQNSPSDVSRIKNIAQQLSDLNSGKATVKQATEVMGNFNNLVDFSKSDVFGHTNDPLEGLIKNTAGSLNNVVRQSSPILAEANDRFSGLKRLQDEIKGMAGKTLNKGELLMRRVFSGDKSGEVQDLFGKIKDETGIDLIKHAVLAKNAIETVGSKADKTLLEQALEGAVSAHKGGIIPSLLNMGSSALKKTVANPERIGRNLVKGKSAGLLKGLLTKGSIEASRLIK